MSKFFHFGCDFSDFYPHFYCGKLKQCFGSCICLPQVSLVYLGIEMVQLCQTFEIISKVESFLCPDKQRTLAKDWRIQQPKHCFNFPQ